MRIKVFDQRKWPLGMLFNNSLFPGCGIQVEHYSMYSGRPRSGLIGGLCLSTFSTEQPLMCQAVTSGVLLLQVPGLWGRSSQCPSQRGARLCRWGDPPWDLPEAGAPAAAGVHRGGDP